MELNHEVYKCYGCGNEIDNRWCWCGDRIATHSDNISHSPIPLGCTCGFEKKVIEDEAEDLSNWRYKWKIRTQ